MSGDAGYPRIEFARRSTKGMVCTVDHLASGAGLAMLHQGGNAVDAAVAASAALAVTTQHMCGMGGDLWALVHRHGDKSPLTLNASGRSGSGSDADQLRAEGHRIMPFRGDIRSVPVPGCVDGWVMLHDRLGRLDLSTVLEPAVELADQGFPVSPLLARAIHGIVDVKGNDDYMHNGSPLGSGSIARRPGLARGLRAIGQEGRSGWYDGEFGRGLERIGGGLYTHRDLLSVHAEWVDPISVRVWNNDLWSVPPNSQGYLSLLAAAIVEPLIDADIHPDDPRWAHLLIEASKQAAVDRPNVLHEGSDLGPVFHPDGIARRRDQIDDARASSLPAPSAGGGTIYLTASDGELAVSLMQSNAAGFGAHLTVPGVGVFLQNRGIGFSLEPGHPAELAPARRPPSTLSPALITTTDHRLRATVGAMGGDGQPQVVLQLVARLLAAGQDSGHAITAPRFTLTVPDAVGFDTWARPDRLMVALEDTTSGPNQWADALAAMGHDVDVRPWGTPMFGHAHIIEHLSDGDGRVLTGVAEPRAQIGAAVGR